MLKSARALTTMLVLSAALLAASSPARADLFGDTRCDRNPRAPGCDVTAGNTSNQSGTISGTGAGQGGDGKCRDPSGQEIPCERNGAYAGADGCYYAPTDPSPSTIAALGGQPAGPGGWYLRTCYGSSGGSGGIVWMPGGPPAISPAVLARQARARLNLPAAAIRMNPPGDQLVNLSVWLALDPASWRPQSATASVPGVSVTATARPVTATWSMGDGTTVTCTGPGTRWTPGTDPSAASPDCGHVYRRPSAGAPGSAYTVTVTVTWEVTWAGAGQSGTVPGLTTTGQVQTRVQESQAVIS